MNTLSWLQTIAPDFLSTIKQRYAILQRVEWLEPVGRRTLAQELDLSERVIRTETDFLKKSGLVTASKSGMSLTKAGCDVLFQLSKFMGDYLGLPQMEQRLASELGINHTLIVSGNIEESPQLMGTVGKILNDTLKVLLPDGPLTLAVMGGTTMAQMSRQLTPDLSDHRQLLFVPARGGVGESVTIQANTVCSKMAQAVGGVHRMLYVPEDISPESYKPLLQEPSIRSVLDLIAEADVVLHSVGDAHTMAARRNMPDQVLKELEAHHACAEAFGYFFNEEGDVVYKIPRIGLQIEDLDKIPYVFVVATGAKKAKAIRAYMKNAPHQTWLITDEGAANQLLKG